MSENELFRTRELETFFERYPDVPREVIVKEDTLRCGVRFSQVVLSYESPYLIDVWMTRCGSLVMEGKKATV